MTQHIFEATTVHGKTGSRLKLTYDFVRFETATHRGDFSQTRDDGGVTYQLHSIIGPAPDGTPHWQFRGGRVGFLRNGQVARLDLDHIQGSTTELTQVVELIKLAEDYIKSGEAAKLKLTGEHHNETAL